MKRESRRERKLRDIQIDSAGNAVYTGALLRLCGDGGRIRRFLALALAALALAVIGSGCIDAAGMTNTYYVILPYIGEVSALFAICWQAVKIIAAGDAVREYVHETAGKTIPGACRVLSVFALFGLAASATFLFRHGLGQSVKSIAYLVLKVLTAAGAERYGRAYRALEWETAR